MNILYTTNSIPPGMYPDIYKIDIDISSNDERVEIR